ncbi:MAG: D-alanyl-D-alanine carboxypeptidase [Deltaproteobacteria bacterium]|nr:MAG: D-alanyl-D-alanine carboxypeptidase [Deltaproteobacteria bacterium]
MRPPAGAWIAIAVAALAALSVPAHADRREPSAGGDPDGSAGGAGALPRGIDPPQLASPSAVVLDAVTGDELYARRADDVRPIASMTKIFVAIALRRHRVDLERWTEIDFDDARASAGGAHTLLLEGQTFRNRDLLYAMLLSSDNRVPSALARSVGLSNDELIAELGRVAADLGLTHTRFDDATGIRGNESTAREMALALREALRDRLLARIMTTRHAQVVSRSAAVTASYTSTVRPLWDPHYKILGGKTGHTDAAGYCLLISIDVAGRRLVISLLGGKTPGARFDDFARLVEWLDSTARPRTSALR